MKHLLPAIRAYLSRELVVKYGLSQFRVAKILGIKQPAVNYAVSGKRSTKYLGLIDSINGLKKFLDEIAESIARGYDFDHCYICRKIYEDEKLRTLVFQAMSAEGSC